MGFSDSNMSPADIAAVTGNNGGFGAFGGDGAWLILILLLFAAFNGNGWGGNGGGVGGEMQRGFDQQTLMGGIGAIQGSLADAAVGQCNQTATLLSTLGGISNQMNTDRFDIITTLNAGHNAILQNLAQCCCDNRAAIADLKYTIATEACANRSALQAGVQTVLDKMCQAEIDALKGQNANLQTQLNLANLASSQTAQTAQILADNAAQTALLRAAIAAVTPTTAASS